MEYWTREPVDILNIMSRYGQFNSRLRPSTQDLDSELPTRDAIDTLDLAIAYLTATRQMAVGLAGGYERAFTQREQRLYLLVDARGNRLVRYVNFEGHFTDEHGYWEFNPVSKTLFVKFSHWGSSRPARECLLSLSYIMDLYPDNSCFPHVCFEGRDYKSRSICIRLGSWTSEPFKSIFDDGTVDIEYWKRETRNILNIMSWYGHNWTALSICDLRPSTQVLDTLGKSKL
jgi:hypothetical protein